jgi:hypothetical protein
MVDALAFYFSVFAVGMARQNPIFSILHPTHYFYSSTPLMLEKELIKYQLAHADRQKRTDHEASNNQESNVEGIIRRCGDDAK